METKMELNAWWASSDTPFWGEGTQNWERENGAVPNMNSRNECNLKKIYSFFLNALAQSVKLNGLVRKGYGSALRNL
jgi:hypothetical protein